MSEAALIFLLIFNYPNGESHEIAVAYDLDRATCQQMANVVWNGGSEIAYYDDQGPVPEIDAACVLPAQLSETE